MRVFVESLKRLYKAGKLDAEKVAELFKNGKISDEEKWDILNTR